MRAVWSFWSKPHYAGRRYAWPSEFHHALAWSLSVQEARRHYPDTWLYTDDEGARLLVDRLQLRIRHIRTDLNELADHDPRRWNLGKLHAYRLQDEPFVHIDNDVFMWLPLPGQISNADMFAEHPEYFFPGVSYYQPERIESAFAGVNGWLPNEWKWYRMARHNLHSEGCGLFGGNRVDFIRYVYDLAFTILDHNINKPVLAKFDDQMRFMALLEEFLPAACREYHCTRTGSPFNSIAIAYLFESGSAMFNPGKAALIGYTHLMGGAKRNPAVVRLLEKRLLYDDPEQYERCRKCLRA